MTTYALYADDAMHWLPRNRLQASLVTSLPDADELGMTLTEYAQWFARAARACMLWALPGYPVIFYQTDRRTQGQTYSKALKLALVAESTGLPMLWHKVVLRHAPGTVDLFRPGYSHMLAFGRGCKAMGNRIPDVIPHSRPAYDNGMNPTAARLAALYARLHGLVLVDPFCGHGEALVAGHAEGLEALHGVDVELSQLAAARKRLMEECGLPHAEVQMPDEVVRA